MRFVIILALGACLDSTEDRLDSYLAAAKVTCWSHHCEDGPGARYPLPSVSTEDGVVCMNDALANGERAVARWSIDVFNPWSTRFTYVFTVDHQVKAFTAVANGPESPGDYVEAPSCAGPFRVGSSICAAMTSSSTFVSVNALAWDGCPD